MNIGEMRRQMVQQQIRTWDVFDQAVLDRIGHLERHRFVPEAYAELAYAETEIPIGHGQKMMSPLLEGRLLQALQVAAGDRVLEIGTGSGYLTACLAGLADHVTSVDIIPEFVDRAAEVLESCGIGNVDLINQDVFEGPLNGEYDVIAVTGSVCIPEKNFLQVLAPGGRMFVVVGQSPVMKAQRVRKGDGGEWQAETLFETELAPLINCSVPEPFQF